MNKIKDLFYSFLRIIDNGKFLIKPLSWFYWVKACLPIILPLAFMYILFTDFEGGMRTIKIYSPSGWEKFVFFIMAILFLAALVFVTYINYLFWTNRAKRLPTVVRTGDSVVAIPLFADNLQNDGECLALYIGILPAIGSILMLIFGILTGNIFEDGIIFKMLGILLGVFIASIISAYFIVLFTHFLAEQIRLLPQIANDVRDMGDIHRAATVTESNNQSLPDIPEIPQL